MKVGNIKVGDCWNGPGCGVMIVCMFCSFVVFRMFVGLVCAHQLKGV